LQELRAKVRVLEVKRSDDARHLRELETRLSEAESFVALRPKLQAKLNSLQTELIATRRELSDVQQLSSLEMNRVADAQEQLEMTTLDKEMAEERAEIAEAELEEVKEKLAVLEVEAEVLRSGGGGADGSAEANIKTSMAYIQLEKQNERLKEALVKLRDMSQETDHEQRRRISEMEKDVASFEELQCESVFLFFYRTQMPKPCSAIRICIDHAHQRRDSSRGPQSSVGRCIRCRGNVSSAD
jgi:dynactin 1